MAWSALTSFNFSGQVPPYAFARRDPSDAIDAVYIYDIIVISSSCQCILLLLLLLYVIVYLICYLVEQARCQHESFDSNRRFFRATGHIYAPADDRALRREGCKGFIRGLQLLSNDLLALWPPVALLFYAKRRLGKLPPCSA